MRCRTPDTRRLGGYQPAVKPLRWELYVVASHWLAPKLTYRFSQLNKSNAGCRRRTSVPGFSAGVLGGPKAASGRNLHAMTSDEAVDPSARASARVLDDTHLELTVRARARDAEATAVLSESRKKTLLKASDDLRIHDPEIETVRDSLTKPEMDATDKAAAITRTPTHRSTSSSATRRSASANVPGES
jgi:hypothetical protein